MKRKPWTTFRIGMKRVGSVLEASRVLRISPSSIYYRRNAYGETAQEAISYYYKRKETTYGKSKRA